MKQTVLTVLCGFLTSEVGLRTLICTALLFGLGSFSADAWYGVFQFSYHLCDWDIIFCYLCLEVSSSIVFEVMISLHRMQFNTYVAMVIKTKQII